MIPVDQTEIGVDNPRANCLMAAVASILEVPIASLPDVTALAERGVPWYEALRRALEPHGLVPVFYDQNSEQFPPIAPAGYHIAMGISPRHEQRHAVVALDGVVVFDPHPTRGGIREITDWAILMPAAQKSHNKES